jgi:ferredoxin-NADP reductase
MQTIGILIGGFVFVYLAMAVAHLNQRSRDWAMRSQLALATMRQQLEAAALLRQRACQQQTAWQGYRTFTVSQRVREAHNVVSFYLKPQDDRTLPEFLPGQAVSLRVRVPGEDKPVERRYSLSSAPNSNCYRVTVKRVSDGKVSSQLLDHFQAGAAIDVEAPAGDFHIREESERPAVLIASGIGVAPFVSMLQSAASKPKHRELTLIYEVRDGFDHAMRNELAALAAANDWLRIVTVFNSPKSDDEPGRDFSVAGHVDVALLKSVLPCSNFEFYISGPGSTTVTLPQQLKDWGVPESSIFCNEFGTASSDADKTASTDAKTSPATLLRKAGTDKLAGTRSSTEKLAAARSTTVASLKDKVAGAKSLSQRPVPGKPSVSVEPGRKTANNTDEILARLRTGAKPERSRETVVWNETVDDDFLSVSQTQTSQVGTHCCVATSQPKLELAATSQ